MSKEGALWASVCERTRQTLACGALAPIECEETLIEDTGVRFIVRSVSSLVRKAAAKSTRRKTSTKGEHPSRVFPFEPDLFVTELGETHVAVLNKFPVIAHHVLIVTKQYVDQQALLTHSDFEALAYCLGEYEALGFYNGGADAGASQQHKHLQLVPLPLGADAAVPMEMLFHPSPGTPGVLKVPGLPYQHGLVWLEDKPAAGALLDAYNALCTTLEIEGVERDGVLFQSVPYNLLVTRGWMLLVPRSREHFRGISVNALGFAGSLFVRGEAQLADIQRVGPMRVLAAVARAHEPA
jgi:sulfate adenylyltransferase (ADP) / ATP adenylyltransferase